MLRRTLFAALACIALPMIADADNARLKLPSFNHLQERATDVVDITIGSLPLGIVGKLLRADDPQEAPTKRLLQGLKSVTVRSYEFDSDFVYSRSDIASIRSQLRSPIWSQLAQVRNSTNHEDVDVYIAHDSDKVTGFALIVTEPRKFTILNIVGAIEPEEVAMLQSRLQLPDLHLSQQ